VFLKEKGITKGDVVSLYMPTCPEALLVMLACTRIGAIHNVIYAALGRDALAARINDSNTKILFAANACWSVNRKIVDLKEIVDSALDECEMVETVIVVPTMKNHRVNMVSGRDLSWSQIPTDTAKSCLCEEMNAEDPLFFLYTSGSTGKPKAIVHTTGGYLTYAAFSFKTIFDFDPQNDVFLNTSDIGWVSCHSYGLYGVLINGGTVMWLEEPCHEASPDRLWSLVRRHRATHIYTNPTTIKGLIRLGDEHVLECPTLRVLGCAGEPIDDSSWHWYTDVVGRGRCQFVDTYWQTETGGVLLGTIPGVCKVIPGHAGLPFLGIEPELVPIGKTDTDGAAYNRSEAVGSLVFKRPWPGLARTIHNGHDRFKSTYLSSFPSSYYAGDGASVDGDGNYRVHGRIDDVINVGPVRFTTAEIEGTLTKHRACLEAAALGMPDPATGECVVAFIVASANSDESDCLRDELRRIVEESLSALAVPKQIYFTKELPKTRSGKVMRRVLRKVLRGDDDFGDVSALCSLTIVDELRRIVLD
jgi:acetyl-CoA synthetase